jgi:hypothetical protein
MASSRELPPSSETNVNILELNETVSRLVAHKGVEVVQILNKAGYVIAESGSSTQATMDSVRSENDDNSWQIVDALSTVLRSVIALETLQVKSLNVDVETMEILYKYSEWSTVRVCGISLLTGSTTIFVENQNLVATPSASSVLMRYLRK